MVFCSSGDPTPSPAATPTPSPATIPSPSPSVPNPNSRSVGRIEHVARKRIIYHKLRTPWVEYPKKRRRFAGVVARNLKGRKI